MDFVENDQWTAADLLRHLRYKGGQLVCEIDYVRGRMMKTDVTVFPDGRFTLTTINRAGGGEPLGGADSGEEGLAADHSRGRRAGCASSRRFSFTPARASCSTTSPPAAFSQGTCKRTPGCLGLRRHEVPAPRR